MAEPGTLQRMIDAGDGVAAYCIANRYPCSAAGSAGHRLTDRLSDGPRQRRVSNHQGILGTLSEIGM